jgi:hypothetical protein
MDECYETLKETAILMEKFARQDKPGSYTSKFRMIFKTPFLRDQFHDLQKKLDQHRTTFSMVLSWYTRYSSLKFLPTFLRLH